MADWGVKYREMYSKRSIDLLFIVFALFILCQSVHSSSDEHISPDDFSEMGETLDLLRKYGSVSYDMDDDDDVYGAPLTSSCIAYLHVYAELASNFTRCSILHARPLRFCENCVDHYVKAQALYDYLMKGSETDDHGRPCRDVILNADRTQVVVLTDRYVNGLWADSYCHNCFAAYHGKNGSVKGQLNNETLHFLDLMKQTQKCFNNYTEASQILPLNMTGNISICVACQGDYKRLNEHYNNMGVKFHGQVCMDVVDTMNYTRLTWSREFLCTKMMDSNFAVGVLATLFGLMPVMFYVGNCVIAEKPKHTKLDKQKRLRNLNLNINDPAVPCCSNDDADAG